MEPQEQKNRSIGEARETTVSATAIIKELLFGKKPAASVNEKIKRKSASELQRAGKKPKKKKPEKKKNKRNAEVPVARPKKQKRKPTRVKTTAKASFTPSGKLDTVQTWTITPDFKANMVQPLNSKQGENLDVSKILKPRPTNTATQTTRTVKKMGM